MPKVKALPIHRGPAGWNEILPSRMPNPPLEDNITADCLVIGAGYAGLSAAHRMAELAPNDHVVVIDAGVIGEGGGGRNSGFMIDLPHDLSSGEYSGDLSKDREQTTLNRAGIAYARHLADKFDMPREVFNPSGKINAAVSEGGHAHNSDYSKHLQRLNEPHEMLDAAQIKEIAGIDYYISGLHTPGAVVIQPAAYVRTISHGLKIYENTPALSFERLSGVWTVTTPKGTIQAPKVILAVNGHAENFGYHKRRLMHVFTYASMSRALNSDEEKQLGGAPNWAFTPADPFGATIRKISGVGGTRLVVRARFSYDPSMQVSNARIASIGKLHKQHFDRRFPMLPNVEMEHVWGGHLCLAWNGVHAFGEVEDGMISAVCQNGLGTARGTLSGKAAAEYACGVDSTEVRGLLGMDAPKRLPPEPFAWIGANATMRWNEYKAGWE